MSVSVNMDLNLRSDTQNITLHEILQLFCRHQNTRKYLIFLFKIVLLRKNFSTAIHHLLQWNLDNSKLAPRGRRKNKIELYNEFSTTNISRLFCFRRGIFLPIDF